jgi:ATP-binding cassette subfamily B protein
MLLRFYDPAAGAVLLDGQDLRSLNLRFLRAQMGLVSQEPALFSASIAENIGYGRPEATEEDIVAAARAAYVDNFVRSLPHGYQTEVTDNGGNLSAGEKQLITIARAFLARPQLLILDEATSSVDTRTELMVQQAMTALRRGRTNFIIAHRLSTIRDADLIVVVDGGRIVEQGSHPELLERRGAYWAMAHSGS